MIRRLVRELFVLVACLVFASALAFGALDATGRHDWWGVRAVAPRFGLEDEEARLRDRPLYWNRAVQDARARTERDLGELGPPATRALARQRLVARGTAALPTILNRLAGLAPAARTEALSVLAVLAPALTGDEAPPPDEPGALAFWERFDRLRGLDFRRVYARRLVQRLVERDSRNAEEQLLRMGTYALPAIFDLLERLMDTDSAMRLTRLLSTLTGHRVEIQPGMPVAAIRHTVEQWRSFWIARRLEYETLSPTRRMIGHVTETRYATWLAHLLKGTLGPARATGRSVSVELRERLPRSLFVGGLGGLLATAAIVAFDGGISMRRRRWRIKLVDLFGALIPGLAAFTAAFLLVLQALSGPHPLGILARAVFARPLPFFLAVPLLAALAALWLRRPSARVLLHAVRSEAESWARESRTPDLAQLLRHGLRVGVASLLAPLGLSSIAVLGTSLVVEPLTRIDGMGSLTLRSLVTWDAPWILPALVSVIPLLLGGRWARRILRWALRNEGTPRASAPGEVPRSEATA